ncbi:unnamed protein product [marine sediment metagenome]|uniref:Uncharacterized protein n=1 Tax=marine sediment metagenome TaxID=412755 RepID=X1K9S8_9ZZZZ
MKYGDYIKFLEHGIIPDYSKKPAGYVASSIHDLLFLGYKPKQTLHKEIDGIIPQTWEVRSKEMKQVINELL